ncbi:hypothetical protein J5N97_001603 [Dioscorea zingiberensis]|uniref:Uncharacterized protein n=1 Tax=Dioscorea zingiberensis TaxID=325984 RepID=A0A9D5H237_9LILI|nr:hypothetical protein J5N97_001603 [Dioscorea zingiberensis]
MGSHDNESKDYGTKRKTPVQLQSLENFYSEDKYPTKNDMEEYAATLKLTYHQIRGWFIERRRRERKQHSPRNTQGSDRTRESGCSTMTRSRNGTDDNTTVGHSRIRALTQLEQGASLCSRPIQSIRDGKKLKNDRYANQKGKPPSQAKRKRKLLSHQQALRYLSSSKHDWTQNTESALFKMQKYAKASKRRHINMEDGPDSQRQHGKNRTSRRNNFAQNNDFIRPQVLFSKDYILRKVFRKDGPPLGIKFDPLPGNAFRNCTGTENLSIVCQGDQSIHQRREVVERPIFVLGTHHEGHPKKHGIGKGLMTVWHATNTSTRKLPAGISFIGGRATWKPFLPDASPEKALYRISKRLQQQKLVAPKRSILKKLPGKRKSHVEKRKVQRSKDVSKKKSHFAKCKLLAVEQKSVEQLDGQKVLVDDEELELRELQAGPNPLRCSAHLPSNGQLGCPLCKDLLARFPPQTVKMKLPLCMKPWDSSQELVKKLFKVFQFLYTHASTAGIYPFTLDEFAQAFHDKDSLLLAKIHVALLRLLLLDAEKVISTEFIPRVSKDCRFLVFLHFVKEQEFDVKFWCQSLNSLTWVEILRQVLVASGFGLKQNTLRRETFNKDRSRMETYGLRRLTLKGELFCILSEQGITGMTVSELARISQIVSLDNSNTTEELEQAIYSTLSSDVTLFEKIAPTTYRLRVNPQIKGADDSQPEDEDMGSVDDDSDSTSTSSGSDDSDDSDNEGGIVQYKILRNKKRCLKVTEETSIDESYFRGGMDLTASSSSCQFEDPVRSLPSIIPNTQYHGSGGKIKKSMAGHHQLAESLLTRPINGVHRNYSSLSSSLVDSSSIFQQASRKRQLSETATEGTAEESGPDSHPLRSIYLGSDRRYNNYWLFLGPCDENDPGHHRVYFESSEDGHWEVIDTTQDLRALLSVLDCRGTREAHLFASLEKREISLCEVMDEHMNAETACGQAGRSVSSELHSSSGDGSSPISDVDNFLLPLESSNGHLASSGTIILETRKNFDQKKQKWDRLQAFDKWIWESFYAILNAVKYSKRSYMDSLARCESCHDLYWRDEKHCRICHTTFELDFDLEERYAIHVATCRETEGSNIYPTYKVLSSQLQALKAAIHAIEAGMPVAALSGSWTRSTHKLWVKRLRRTASLPELLQVLTDFVRAINEEWLQECTVPGSSTAIDEIIVYFQTMPQTTSAVALWMFKLDSLIGPHLESLHPERTSGGMTQVKRRHICTR